jgi:uncharacterized protein YukE
MDIKVDSGGVRGTLGSFQGQVSALEAKFDEIAAKTAAVKGSWEGDDADAILPQIEKFKEAFDAVRAKNKTYIAFMESSAANYDTEDSQLASAANELDN